MIADHIYGKYDVFKRFKPLAVGIDQDLVAALPQLRPCTDCTRTGQPLPPSALSESLGSRRQTFDLNNRFKGEVSAEEQTIAQQHPAVQQALAAQAERQAAKATAEAEAAPAQAESNEAAE